MAHSIRLDTVLDVVEDYKHMSTDAPIAPTVRKGLTPEQKAAMAAGRTRAAAEKKAAKSSTSDVDARLAALDSKFDAVMAALAKMSAPVVAPTPQPASPPSSRIPDEILPPRTVSASKGVEAAYVYMTRQGTNRERVNLRINDPDDERWEGALLKAPFNGDPMGALEVAIVTRVDGEIVQSKDIFGGPAHMNVARAFIRQFAAAKAAGADKPWDVERYFRDKKEEEARLKREGRVEELLAMRTLMVEALKGVVATGDVAA